MVDYKTWPKIAFYSVLFSIGLNCQGGCTQKSVPPDSPKLLVTTSQTSATSTASTTATSTTTNVFPCTMDLGDIVKYQEIKDGSGQNYFTNVEICLLKDIPPDYSKAIAETKHLPAFYAPDIITFSRYKVPAEFAQELGEFTASPYGLARDGSFPIARFYQLGLTAEEVKKFKDTAKPNLIVAYPFSLDDQAFENDDALKLFQGFKQEYDIWTIVWSTEDEIYQAMDTIPNASFWGNGHGTKTTMSSSGPQSPLLKDDRSNEQYFIDTGDTEIATHLAKLDPNGFIFMSSCGNGEGGLSDDSNLLNFLFAQAGGRDVLGAETSFNASKIKVISYHPLQIIVDTSFHKRKRN